MAWVDCPEFWYILGAAVICFFAWGLLPEIIPGTQYWEGRRRHDYCQQFGQQGRWETDSCGRDHYTAMMRKKNPRWISKFPSNNHWYMFDESVEDRREIAKQYSD